MNTVILDLDSNGDLLDPENGEVVPLENVPYFLELTLAVPKDATDIVVFVHGWRTSPARALGNAGRFFAGISDHLARDGERYPGLDGFSGFNIAIRWPSRSLPFRRGFRRIRDRAHLMSTEGHAGAVLAHLLGYLNAERRKPGPEVLRTVGGQYLHCVGHSFGGRFLCEAIQESLGPEPTPTLAYDFADLEDYPYTVDTLLIFQLATKTDAFEDLFPRLLGQAPINCPIVLTHSSADRATGLWHTLAEGGAGIGYKGATAPAESLSSIRLRPVDRAYDHVSFATRIVNVDATWRYRRGAVLFPQGAHSDFWHPESFHLFLSLAELAR